MSKLLDQIDELVADAAHRVLVQAAENVGECTYAANMPGYLRALKDLRATDLSWWNYVGEDRHNRIVARLIHFHREMYRQPCLICATCQSRAKFWRDSAYTTFGDKQH